MISFNNGGILIESASELPNFFGCVELFGDFETSSKSPREDSLNPHHNCYIAKSAGLAITVDDCQNSYYIPARILLESIEWWRRVVDTCGYWINHNIKYDAHVSANCLQVIPTCPLVDTVSMSKLIDSDRITRGGYGLDALASGWLKEDIKYLEERLQPYLGKKNKDYGEIPLDILAEYGCQDPLTNRRLWKYIQAQLPEECYNVFQTEIKLTQRLFQMERNGMPIDLTEIQLTQYQTLNKISDIDTKLSELVGRSFNPASNEDCYDVLINQYGLPIVAYTKDEFGEDTANASFDKHALAMYSGNPYAPQAVITGITDYRKLWQFNNLFLEPWQQLAVQHGSYYTLHPQYTQIIRTGRMACSDPNAQQLSDLAKKLIHPKPGYAIIVVDASQIEFRFIAHYIRNARTIDAFNLDPDTDFHNWVASLCDIKRKPAKTVNFLTAFGGGKKKLLLQLTKDLTLVANIKEQVDELVKSGKCPPEQQQIWFDDLAIRRATDVYNRYHSSLPEIKATSKAVENVCKQRGYVRTMYNRRRHLPYKFAYRAFNTVNQGSAADFFKDRFNALCDMLDGTSIETMGCIHDAVVMQAPIEIAHDRRTQVDIIGLLEAKPEALRVPVRWSIGVDNKDWKSADSCAATIHYEQSEVGYLNHLR